MKTFISLLLVLNLFIGCSLVFGNTLTAWRLGENQLEPGDILVQTNANEWRLLNTKYDTGHVALYVGDLDYDGDNWWQDQTIEAVPSALGVAHFNVGIWDDPSRDVYVIRVNATPAQKQGAIKFAIDQLGEGYSYNYTNSQYHNGNDNWYCTELVWASYKSVGIDLFPKLPIVSSLPRLVYAPIRPSRFLELSELSSASVIHHRLVSDLKYEDWPVFNVSQERWSQSLSDALKIVKPNDELVLTGDALREKVTITTASLTLSAASGENFFFYTSDKDYAAITIAAPNVTVKNMFLLGAVGQESAALVVAKPGTNALIDNCVIGFNTGGLALASTSAEVKNCRFYKNHKAALGLTAAYGSSVHHNNFQQNQDIIWATPNEVCVYDDFYDDSLLPGDLSLLRDFRDIHLTASAQNLYYRLSPDLIIFLKQRPLFAVQSAISLSDWLDLSLKKRLAYIPTDWERNLAIKAIDETTVSIPLNDSDAEALASLRASLSSHNSSVSSILDSAGFLNSSSEDHIAKTVVNDPPNYIFLNNFGGNKSIGRIDYSSNKIIFHSKSPIKYRYQNRSFYKLIGNYWGERENRWPDSNADGISEESFYWDTYVLVKPFQNYLTQEEINTGVPDWTLY